MKLRKLIRILVLDFFWVYNMKSQNKYDEIYKLLSIEQKNVKYNLVSHFQCSLMNYFSAHKIKRIIPSTSVHVQHISNAISTQIPFPPSVTNKQ